jgi:hypothetical protein
MAIGSSIFDFSTCCFALRSCAYVHAIALGLALLHQEYFSVRGTLFLRAISRKHTVCLPDNAFRCVSTIYMR